jgi:hypothetical protein
MAMQYSFDTYIAQYLQREGRCAIPHWGVLRCVWQSAQWNNNKLRAPQQNLLWEHNAQTSNLLLSQIATDTQTELPLVKKAYAVWLKHLEETLDANLPYKLAELGTWSKQNNTVTWESNVLFQNNTEVSWPSGLSIPNNENEPETLPEEVSEEPSTQNNTLLYVALGLLILILAGGLFWYNQNKQSEANTPITETTTLQEPRPRVDTVKTNTVQSDTVKTDTLQTTSNAPLTSNDSNRYDVVVYRYSTEAKAQKQANKFTRNGNNSSVVRSADSQYLVVIRAVTTQTDTQRVVDSIRCFFNPKGRLYILK